MPGRQSQLTRHTSFGRLKLEIKRASIPFAALVVLWIIGLLAIADILGNLAGLKPWDSYAYYRMAFTNLQGVQPGRVPVDVAGVKAGAITKEQLVDGQPVLTIAIASQYAPLYRNAVVKLRPFTPLDNLYLDITSRGTPSAGKLGSEILPTSQTVSPVQISNVLDVFNASTRTNLSSLIDELGSGLHGNGQELRYGFEQLMPFLETAKQISTAVTAQGSDLRQLIHASGSIMQTLALRDHQLTGFITTANSTLGAISQRDPAFGATLSELPPMMSALQSSLSTLQSSETHIDPALQSLGSVASALPDGLSGLRTLAVSAQPALQSLTPVSAKLLPFASVLRPTAADLRTAVSRLHYQAPQINASTATITPCESVIAHFLSGVMSITKLGDVGPQSNIPNVPSARADVQVSLDEGELGPSQFTVIPPCFG